MPSSHSLNGTDLKSRHLIPLFCVLVSVIVIGLCSRSSPLYPLNNWDDCNCFFTVGKCIANGKVPYRDIYEQKGPVLYFLYAAVYLLSQRSFLGAYFIEVIAFSVFLYLVFEFSLRCFNLKLLTALILVPLMSALFCTGLSFYLGGSVEQIFICAIFLPVYSAVSVYTLTGRHIPSKKTALFLGMGAGFLLWTKFTLLGIYIGYILFLSIYCICRKEYKKLFISALYFIIGSALVSIPVLIYFAVNHATNDLFESYFYNNIFIYSGVKGKSLLICLRYIASAIIRNPAISIPMLIWIVRVIVGKEDIFFKLCMLCLYGSHIIFTYIGCTAFVYYAFALVPLAVPGYLAAAKKLQEKFVGTAASVPAKLVPLISCLSILLCAVISHGFSNNSFYMHYKTDDLWFEQFASIIEDAEDKSLFNYGYLDTGLYTVTGYIPDCKYFCKLNIPLPEMYDEAERIVSGQEVEWIVTCSDDDELLNQYYQLEMSIEHFRVWEDNYSDYYLYRRK